MGGSNTAPERYTIPQGATENIQVSFKPSLRSGELLDGTTGGATLTIVDETTEGETTALTLTNKAFNSSTITIGDDSDVIAGQAILFTVTGQQDEASYRIIITVHTDAGRTLLKYIHLKCADK